ncbi:MAG TPA: hypothetical protein ENL03_01945 [Phycisphaerae bacterium]|nr:hypothetical protein [Phycisphaerae bacterium]
MTKDRFNDAKDYLFRSGRSLEQQLFRYHFEDGDAEPVLHELATHQMPDGGFRNMGEGNNDVSSPIGTTCAFQHLAKLRVQAEHPVVQRGINYLISVYDSSCDAWPQKADDSRYLEKELDLHWGNPGAEIVGYLWKYQELVPDAFLEHVTALAIKRFYKLPLPVPGFADLCYVRLAQWIPKISIQKRIYKKVTEGVHQNLELNHKRWHTCYFIKPYWYALTPDSPLHNTLEDEIHSCLDFDIEMQETDGSAYLSFEVNGDALRTWKSIWTLESLIVLNNYCRIEQ